MKNNKIRKLFGVFALALGLVATPMAATPALADTGGGIGGGGGPGGAYDGFQWISVAYNDKGKAWNEFKRLALWSDAERDREVINRVGNLKVCQDSNVIWFIRSAGGWTFNFTGWTHPSNYKIAGTIENPHSRVGDRAPYASEVNAFKTWDRNVNGNRIDNTPGYTIICSGAFDKPDLKGSTTTKSSPKVSNNSDSWTQPYSYSTEIKRQTIAGSTKDKADPIGNDNLETQDTKTVKTNFGKLWDELNLSGGKGLSPDQLRAKVQQAINKDAAVGPPTLDLSKNNQAGMAEGGVLNVLEQTKLATVGSTEKTTIVTTTVCDWVQKWNPATGSYGAKTNTSCKSTDAVTKSSTAIRSIGTLKNTGFWQMLAVHCNEAEFEALMNSDKSLRLVKTNETAMDKVGEGKIFTGVAHTKKYNQQPEVLDFGNQYNPNKAKAATGKLGFYDKECALDCVAAPFPEAKDSQNNGLFGAVSDKTNTNSFEFFRDGQDKEIVINKWVPADGKWIDYKDTKAKTTTINRWSEGTPSVTGKDSKGNPTAGKFSMSASGKPLFQGTGKPQTQKNWDSTPSSSATSTVLTGEHNKFKLKSTWASEAAKPQILNVKWEYEVSVTSVVPVKGLGFDASGNQLTGNPGWGYFDTVKADNIQGKCYANFGTTGAGYDGNPAPVDTKSMFQQFTGTGSTNTLDSGTVEKLNTNNPGAQQTNLVANFVRSASE